MGPQKKKSKAPWWSLFLANIKHSAHKESLTVSLLYPHTWCMKSVLLVPHVLSSSSSSILCSCVVLKNHISFHIQIRPATLLYLSKIYRCLTTLSVRLENSSTFCKNLTSILRTYFNRPVGFNLGFNHEKSDTFQWRHRHMNFLIYHYNKCPNVLILPFTFSKLICIFTNCMSINGLWN